MKVSFGGVVLAVQSRIRMTRSFDERAHTYLGYALRIHGVVDGEPREFSVGIGPAAQAEHQIGKDDRVRGVAEPVADSRLETVEFYKVSKFVVDEREPPATLSPPPPWHGAPPDLTVYRTRGARRLDGRTFTTKCSTCIWSCNMAVEMIVDHWKPDIRRYRTETFCYGPKSCRLYRPGRCRVVPGRKGMSWVEEDWVDEEETRHRGLDD
jgi:hypothetical protein